MMFNKLSQFALLIRLDKPIGTFLLLWPTYWGLWIAGNGQPSAKNLIIFTIGVFIMRSAGCVINDIADREIDLHVERTKQRPITSGQINLTEAFVFFFLLCFCAGVLVLNLNLKAILFSIVGLCLVIAYPFMKRLTHLPQLFLGVAFAWGIPMAFSAEINQILPIVWWLMLANIFWVVAYDTILAMADKQDDLRIGVKSTAVLFGQYDRILVLTCQFVVIVLLYFIGLSLKLNSYYFMCLIVSVGFAAYQVWLYFTRDPQKCFRAFLNNAWFGASIFAGLVLAYLPG